MAFASFPSFLNLSPSFENTFEKKAVSKECT